MEPFWKLKPGQRAELIRYQWEKWGLKLEIAGQEAPWQKPQPAPEIPVGPPKDTARFGEKTRNLAGEYSLSIHTVRDIIKAERKRRRQGNGH